MKRAKLVRSMQWLLSILILQFFQINFVFAQAWPNKSIRIIVPQGAAGSTDQVARPLAKLLSDELGQPVYLENRPGSGSVNGTDVAAKSAPNGYTFLAVAVSFSISPSIYKKLPYDVLKDFEPVTQLASFPNVLVVTSALPVKTVKELIAYAKANPGKLNYGTSGIGTGTHLSMELFKHMAGVEMVHVPYKGGATAVNALLANEVQVNLATISTAIPHIKAGKLRALAVSGRYSVPSLPGIPTLAESGLSGYEYDSWIALLAPAKTPKAILEKMSAATFKASQSPEMKVILDMEGAKPVGSSPEEFQQFLKAEIARWKKVVDYAGILPE